LSLIAILDLEKLGYKISDWQIIFFILHLGCKFIKGKESD
jgi:hypothetical protein